MSIVEGHLREMAGVGVSQGPKHAEVASWLGHSDSTLGALFSWRGKINFHVPVLLPPERVSETPPPFAKGLGLGFLYSLLPL